MNEPLAPGILAAEEPSWVGAGMSMQAPTRPQAAVIDAIFRTARTGIVVADLDGRRIRVNTAFCEMTGHDEAALLALDFRAQTHPDDLPLSLLLRDSLLAGEREHYNLQRRFRRADGSWLFANVTVSLVSDGAGCPSFTVLVIEDLTDQRRSAQVLADAEHRYQATFDRAGVGITHVDASGRHLSINDAFCELLGYTSEALLALPFDALIHPDESDAIQEARARLLAGEVPSTALERRYRRSDGSWIWGLVTTTVARNGDGTPYTIAIVRDITARRHATDAMRESEARFRSLIEFSSDWYWEQDEQLRFTVMSGGAVTSRDLVAEDWMGRHLWELPWLPGTDEAAWTAHKAQLARREPFRELVLSRLAADGTPRHVSISGEPIFTPEGAFRGYRGVSIDVTHRVVFERQLREREAENRLLAEIVNQSQDAIITRDLDNRIVIWNAGAARLFGYAAADAVGRNATELLDMDPSPETVALRIERLRAGVSITRRSRSRTADDRLLDIEISLSPLRDAEGRLVGQITISRDLTARIEAEQALRASEARNRLLAAVVEQSSEAIVIKDLDNIVLSWNQGAERIYGWRPAEAVGRNMTLLVRPASTGADVARRIALLRRCVPGTWRTVSHRRDGTCINVDVNVSPLFDEHGRHIGEITMVRDITERERAEAALRATQARNRELALIVDQSYDAIITKDVHNRVLTWNRGAERIFGWSADEALGQNYLALVSPDASEPELRAAIDRIETRKAHIWEAVRSTRDGRRIHVEVTLSPLFDEDGQHLGEISINRDISERVQAEEALRDQRLFLEQAQEVGGIGSWALSLNGGTLTWSDETKRIFGIGREAFDGFAETFWQLVHPEDVARVRAANDQAFAARRPMTNEYRIVRPDGAQRWLHEHAAIICDDQGQPLRIVGVVQDITERRAAQERIEFLATRDPLTELPNRLLLRDRITHAMAGAARSGTQLALLFIDLDQFKTINDSLGHWVGDELLKQVAERLASCVRMEDTLARLGGDEFVLLLQGLGDAEAASQVASKVLKLLACPYLIEGHQLSTSCSIGISLYPTDGSDAQALMKNADAAMYHAKERGRGNYQYFSADLHSRAVERLSIETALRRALDRGEFELHFQPQLLMDDSTVVGMEALLRWNHPDEGLLAPGRFIRIAEESGLIVPLGDWVLNAACAQVREWLDAGLAPPRLAVNVSVGQLSRGFVRSVGRTLQAHRIDGSRLELEMTESLLMQHVDENVNLLRRIGDLGVQIALDDFGTGYSSLAYLKKFPIDALKIDRTFVRDIVDDPDDSAITAAVVSIGHHMQLRVIAEGVETPEQLAILRSMGCDEYQGYLFSRPLPVAGFAERFLGGGAPPGLLPRR